MTLDSDPTLQEIRRQLRIIAILSACRETDLIPLPAQQLHVIAYFADALAPVWGLRIIDAQLLKRESGPMSPLLQRDLDRLVGRGVVLANSVRHLIDRDGDWRLEANYELSSIFADRIITTVRRFEPQVAHFDFVREVVYAMSGLGLLGISAASASDASYSDELIDFGGLIDIAGVPGDSSSNPTVRVARRFSELLDPNVKLTSAEMVHLYVRELHTRMNRAA